jgi:hypothetical protein
VIAVPVLQGHPAILTGYTYSHPLNETGSFEGGNEKEVSPTEFFGM